MNFIVAESLRQASNTAEIDWGWRRIRNDEWETPAGERVRYLVTGWLPEHKGSERFRRREDTGEVPRLQTPGI